ncbi:hypothetical protein BaRGS_00004895, partial [Batillaria attramentaria]
MPAEPSQVPRIQTDGESELSFAAGKKQKEKKVGRGIVKNVLEAGRLGEVIAADTFTVPTP